MLAFTQKRSINELGPSASASTGLTTNPLTLKTKSKESPEISPFTLPASAFLNSDVPLMQLLLNSKYTAIKKNPKETEQQYFDRITTLILDGVQLNSLILELPQNMNSRICYMDCSNNKIDSLDGLSDFPNLLSLTLKNNQISNISSLNCFPRLRMLDLSFNAISMIEGLALPRLEELILNSQKEVLRIEPDTFDVLYSLQRLDLSTNSIETDFKFLRSLRKLTSESLTS